MSLKPIVLFLFSFNLVALTARQVPAAVQSKLKRQAEWLQSTIRRAEFYLKKHQRIQAMETILRAYFDLQAGRDDKRVLLGKAQEYSEMFLTEKGQRFFEWGQSTLMSDPEGAMQKFKNSLEFEDQNMRVLKGLLKAQLEAQKWHEADENLQQMQRLNPFDREVPYLRAQRWLWQGNRQEFLNLVQSDQSLRERFSEQCLVEAKTAVIDEQLKKLCYRSAERPMKSDETNK